jgi:Fur family transcriptional regulator, ferric uptake regulator
MNRLARLMIRSKQALLTELRQKGFRMTPQRERVIDIFYDLPAGEHLNAEDLYRLLKSETRDISLATTYRALKLLASVGVLREEELTEDGKFYELARDEEAPHYHLICTTCGLTTEFESPLMLNEATQVATAFGFELKDMQLKLQATCLPDKPDCPNRQSR